MKRGVKFLKLLVIVLSIGLMLYGMVGYWDAVQKSDEYITKANTLIKNDRGPGSIGAERLKQLFMVQDPAFREHYGIDLWTAGAGLTTVSQSLAKRLGFNEFRPGIGKIRQSGFALGLESKLSKDQILALFLDTVEMGKGPNGWMTGFYNASEEIFAQPPSLITNNDFLKLVAVMISPAQFNLTNPKEGLKERTSRIAKLVRGACVAKGLQDVWFENCS